MTTMSTTKRKRVSKKNKVSWRKHVNIDDVDVFLEEKRLDERLGKPVASLTNDELFQVDTTPQNATDSLSTKQRQRLRSLAPPKCFSVLQPHTKVPDPITKRNRVRTKEERRCPIVKKKEEENRLNGIFKAKDLQRVKDIRTYRQRLKDKPTSVEFNEDIWSVDVDDRKFGKLGDWVAKNTKRHTLRGIGNLTKRVPRVVGDKSYTPSIELPHPGTSYNPGYEDHQNLLREVTEREARLIKQDNHLNRVTKDMFRKVTAGNKESSWLVEMSQGLPKPDESFQDDVKKGESYETPGLPVLNKKKSTKQRRKQREQLRLEKLRADEKVAKKKRADMHKLKFINRAIEEGEEEKEASKEKRARKAMTRAQQTKRLGRYKFEEPQPDFNFSKDITGNLRKIKREGNILADRFVSMQKRNILEICKLQVYKRGKIKRYRKPGFKEDWKKTVARTFT